MPQHILHLFCHACGLFILLNLKGYNFYETRKLLVIILYYCFFHSPEGPMTWILDFSLLPQLLLVYSLLRSVKLWCSIFKFIVIFLYYFLLYGSFTVFIYIICISFFIFSFAWEEFPVLICFSNFIISQWSHCLADAFKST